MGLNNKWKFIIKTQHEHLFEKELIGLEDLQVHVFI